MSEAQVENARTDDAKVRPIPVARRIDAGPVGESQRIASLDVLRGFAVLGILVVNIQSFSMISAAYMNPTATGDLNGTNYWVWLVSHVLVEQKFIAIFSMLFGAGIVLMADRREAAGRSPAAAHYRRMAVLLVIGLAHGYLLWEGDILCAYAICGLVVYLFRRRRPGVLIALGLAGVAVASAISLFFGWSMAFWPAESITALQHEWAPTQEMIQQEVAAYRGGWFEQMSYRAPITFFFQTLVFITDVFWWASGMMLLGMALFKLGVLSAARSDRFYVTLIVLAVGVGLPMVLYGVHQNFAAGWEAGHGFFLGRQYNCWASILVSLGWVSAVMLVCRHNLLAWLTRRLAAVGRMALSNYLLQTVICTTIFYGHGLGLFGSVERPGQIAIVLAVLALQLVLSPIWLGFFRFGPVEWLWRAATYMHLPAMRRT